MPEPARSLRDTGDHENDACGSARRPLNSDQSSQLIVDCHLDLAWNALGYKRDLTLPLAELNRGEQGLADHAGRGLATTTLPEMRAGGVGLCLATLIARTPVGATAIHGNLLDYPTPAAAAAVAAGQLAWYRALAEAGAVALLGSADAVRAHAERWRGGNERRVGIVLAMEGSDPIISPAHVPRWHAAGLRVASLVHYGLGRYAAGTGTDGGVTAAGRALLAAFEEAGLILDVTHLSDRAFLQALDRYAGPLLASHQNCRALVPGGRQFTDQQLRLVLDRGGIVAVACDAWMLHPGWVRGETGVDQVPMTALADHVDHICQLAGNADQVAVGSDLDGGFGSNQTPRELTSIADLGRLAPILADRGYTGDQVTAVLADNALRFLTTHLPIEAANDPGDAASTATSQRS